VPSRLPGATDEEVAALLLPVRGIGPWSVDMFLMFALARPDVLPVGDLGVRKGMVRHFRLRKLPEPDRMQQLAAPWRPFRSVGSWYMWRLLETEDV
jgi:DNA-3-methyladenine glycosylase II